MCVSSGAPHHTLLSHVQVYRTVDGPVLVLTSLCSDPPPVLREQEKNWPCYECNRRFVSSEQLQQHLNMHDDKLDYVSKPRGRGRGRGRKRFGTGRRPGRPPKFIRLEPPVDTSVDKTAVWRDCLVAVCLESHQSVSGCCLLSLISLGLVAVYLESHQSGSGCCLLSLISLCLVAVYL